MRRLLVAPLTLGLLVPTACNGDGDGGGTNVEAYCDAMRAFEALQDDLADPSVPAGASFDEQMQAMRDTFEPVKARIDDLRDAAPAEVRGDVEELTDAAEELLDLFLSAESIEDLTDPSLIEQMTRLQEDAEGARDRVADFTLEECGIDLTGE